ncbi:MAG: hypothetical protein OHK0035_30900 [Cyanobacteria bacterium J069]
MAGAVWGNRYRSIIPAYVFCILLYHSGVSLALSLRRIALLGSITPAYDWFYHSGV